VLGYRPDVFDRGGGGHVLAYRSDVHEGKQVPLTKASRTSLACCAPTGETITSPCVKVVCVHMAFSIAFMSTPSRRAALEGADSGGE
jgi:hypothetical protein